MKLFCLGRTDFAPGVSPENQQEIRHDRQFQDNIAFSFLWDGGVRIFSLNGAPPLIGWFMPGAILLGGALHLALEGWAWRPAQAIKEGAA